jgi:hypothetical protein
LQLPETARLVGAFGVAALCLGLSVPHGDVGSLVGGSIASLGILAMVIAGVLIAVAIPSWPRAPKR